MWEYLVKRLFLLVLTLFGISIISFLVMTLAPGDPATMRMGTKGRQGSAINDYTIRKNRELYYLDRPRLVYLPPVNGAPPTRRTTVEKALRELEAKNELERKEAQLNLESAIGTAGLDVILDVLPARAAEAAEARAALDRRLAALEQAATDAERAAALGELVERYPGAAPQLQVVQGKLPPVAERTKAWLRQRAALTEEAEGPARRVLAVLRTVVTEEAGGPKLAADAPVADAVAAWQGWWKERAGDFSDDAVRAAVDAWLAKGDVAAVASDARPSPELDALKKVGQRAAPRLMAALQDADEGSPAEQRAGYALSVVVKKPWDFTSTPDERQAWAAEWTARKDELEQGKAEMHPAAYAREVAALGTLDEFLAGKDREAAAEHRHLWSDWWYRAEENYVDFSTGRQVVRAVTQTQFGRWMTRFVRLDFGESYDSKRPVWDLLAERLPRTLILNAISLTLVYLLAVPLGIFSAVRKDSLADRITTVVLFLLYSLPVFWVGSILIMTLTGEGKLPAHHFRSLEGFDRLSTWGQLVDVATHLILPVLCLTYAELAYVSRQMRTGLLDVIRQDYIRTARAKGLPERLVINKHALRNGLIPILTLMGTLLPVMFGGSVIVESIFSIEGLGKLAFDAILKRDYPVIMADLVIAGFLTLLGILLADIAYAVVDPRIEFR